MKNFSNYNLENSFGLPCIVTSYHELETKEDVESFFSGETNSDALVIGGTSNSVLPSRLEKVARITAKQVLWSENEMAVEAGMNWHELVIESCKKGLWGIQNLVAIPGDVGAAPVQNIGAYGSEFSDTCVSLEVFDKKEKVFKILKKEECDFGYRTSLFKKEKGRYVIWNAVLLLSKKPPVGKNEESPLEVAKEIEAIRWSKLPNPKQIPNVGSCFGNPFVSSKKAEELKKEYESIPLFDIVGNPDLKKVSAGWLIEQVGMKGYDNNEGVSVYENHALVFINKNKEGTQSGFVNLSELVKKKVFEKFGIMLEVEPEIINNKSTSL